jgi:NAD-dependent dihydropyrimidine dehydrogenase PreA subunit
MKRKIIKIDEEKCTGCGVCVPNCHEQAIKIIDGKAMLVNDVFCDGLGACLGECPEGALTLEERDTEPFDEKKVLEALVEKESAAMEDHLTKLAASGDTELHKEYGNFLKMIQGDQSGHGCPGSAHTVFEKSPNATTTQQSGSVQSELTHWPIQLHLVNPQAEFLRGKDVVLAADCVAYSLADFHSRFLKGKSLIIACPKLDSGMDEYIEKIRQMVDEAKINTLTVIMMQVPCCRGLLQIAQAALQKAKRKVPLKAIVISTQGKVLSEEWV